MPRVKEEEDLTKHTMWLRRGDIVFLKDHFPNKASKIVRRLIAHFVDQTKLEMAEANKTVEAEPANINLKAEDI